MLAKKFALGIGIAVLLPMLVHYGVSMFTASPRWKDYQIQGYYSKVSVASTAEKARLLKQKEALDKKWVSDQKRFQRNLFYVAILVGIGAIIIGSLNAIPAIGTGLMFGGIFTLLDGYALYWVELQDWMRFLSLLAAFGVLIYIGSNKFTK